MPSHHVTAIIADPLLFSLDPVTLNTYRQKLRSITTQLPLTNVFTHVGNNQLHSFAYSLWASYNHNSQHVGSPHPAAQSSSPKGWHQFAPMYTKLGISKWNPKTKTTVYTPTPNVIYAEGNKDQLLNANALMDAWHRCINHKKLKPHYVLVLDPLDRLSKAHWGHLGPQGQITSNNITTTALKQAVNDCILQSIPYNVVAV